MIMGYLTLVIPTCEFKIVNPYLLSMSKSINNNITSKNIKLLTLNTKRTSPRLHCSVAGHSAFRFSRYSRRLLI